MEKQVCSNCGSSYDDIKASGFVGCEECYKLDGVKAAVRRLFGDKIHKGKRVNGNIR